MDPVVREIDEHEAIAYLRAAVARRGADYVYSEHFDKYTCQYVYQFDVDEETDDPIPVTPCAACLVGEVFITDLSIPLTAFRWKLDRHGELESDGSLAEHNDASVEEIAPFLSRVGYTLSKGAIAVLARAQEAQDNYKSWGEALHAAEQTYADGAWEWDQ